ncbi:MAG TPA: Wzz/FepE/Etk N-terminal domain-containing protein [Solirubrobacteraceae bacterium]|nr:Wzz/FepE/Etk N-terminal domain-containing protein [Solirubrobacteraceae bacterium]
MAEPAPLNPVAGRADDPSGAPPGILAVMRRWRWMIALAAVAAGAVGYVVASSGSPSYQARAVLLVGPINTDNADTLKASGQLAQTYAQLATSRPVLAATSRRLGGVRNIGDSVAASANAVTRLLTVTVTTRDPELGARIANTEARTLIDIAKGEVAVAGAPSEGAPAPTASRGESGSLRVVDPAEASSAPSGRSAAGIAIIAAVGGLLGALGLALLLDRSGDAITDLDELRAVTGSGVLAAMSPAALTHHRRYAGHRSDPDREFRLLAARLNAIGERSLLVVVVDADGLAFTTRLAEALVTTGASVAVVDAGRPRVGAARETVHADAPVNVLPAGERDDPDGLPLRIVSPPSEDGVHGADAARGMVEDLLGSADTVLVAAPSLQSSPSALTWARVVDGTILVVGLERTGRGQVTAVVENLRLVHARVLGTIVAGGARTMRR